MAEWSDRIRQALAGRTRRVIPDTYEDPPLVRAAVLMPLYMMDGQVYILLTRRTDKVDHHKGQVSFPGGRCDATDRDCLDTALREAYEEVGLRREDVEILGVLDDMLTTTGFVVTPYVGVIPHPYELALNEHEVAAALHVPLSVFVNPTHFREELWERNGQMIPIQFYTHNEDVIWGATARMIKSFIEETAAPAPERPPGVPPHSAARPPSAIRNPPCEDRYLSVSGRALHYLEWPAPGRPSLVLVHGSFQTAHSWDEFAAAMRGRYRLLALDQRGHGDSEWAPRYTLDDYVQDLDAAMDAWHTGPAAFLGMSMGGLNAMVYAVRHPERVARLALIDVGPELQESGLRVIRNFLVSVPDEFPSLEEAVDVASVYNPRRSKENLRERLSHTLRRRADGRWVWKHDPRFKALGGPYSERPPDLWGYWDRLTCPTWIVRGQESNVFTHETAVRMVERLPGAILAEVPGAGHSVVGDNLTGFLAAVEPFLSGL